MSDTYDIILEKNFVDFIVPSWPSQSIMFKIHICLKLYVLLKVLTYFAKNIR